MRVSRCVFRMMQPVLAALVFSLLSSVQRVEAEEKLFDAKTMSSFTVTFRGEGHSGPGGYEWSIHFSVAMAQDQGQSGIYSGRTTYTYEITFESGIRAEVKREMSVSASGWDTASRSLSMYIGELVLKNGIITGFRHPNGELHPYCREAIVLSDITPTQTQRSNDPDNQWDEGKGWATWTVHWGPSGSSSRSAVIRPSGNTENPCALDAPIEYRCYVGGGCEPGSGHTYKWYIRWDGSKEKTDVTEPIPNPWCLITWTKAGTHMVGCTVTFPDGTQQDAIEYGQTVGSVPEYVDLESDKAMNRIEIWRLGEKDEGDPSAAGSTSKALIIPYGAVYDPTSVCVVDYTIKGSTTVAKSLLGVRWDYKYCAYNPNEDRDITSNSYTPGFPGPKRGGVHPIYFRKVANSTSKTTTYVLCPLAGADMTDELKRLILAAPDAFGTHWRKASERFFDDWEKHGNDVKYEVLTRHMKYWKALSAKRYAHLLDPVSSDGQSPTQRFKPKIDENGNYGYVTVNGVVVHGVKLNNMIWSLIGQEPGGFTNWQMWLGSQYNQVSRSWDQFWNHDKMPSRWIDTEAAAAAVGFGGEIVKWVRTDPATRPPLSTVLTPKVLRSFQEPDEITYMLWPSLSLAGPASTFRPPDLDAYLEYWIGQGN